MATRKKILDFRPGDRCNVQIGRIKRQLLVISRTHAFDRALHYEALRLADARGTLRVQISISDG